MSMIPSSTDICLQTSRVRTDARMHYHSCMHAGNDVSVACQNRQLTTSSTAANYIDWSPSVAGLFEDGGIDQSIAPTELII